MTHNALTERRKADRTKMAAIISELCAKHGATCAIRDDATHIWDDGSRPSPEYRNRLMLSIALDGLAVGLSLDGNRTNSMPDCFCLPWNSDKRMSDMFGRSQGASVNPYHRKKCTAFADGFDHLLIRLEAAFLRYYVAIAPRR